MLFLPSPEPYGVVPAITVSEDMSTKHLGAPKPRRPASTRPPSTLVGHERAVWLITVHYTKTYGQFIRYENPRTMRLKIDEAMEGLQKLVRGETAYVMLARTIRDYERIAELLEMFTYY